MKSRNPAKRSRKTQPYEVLDSTPVSVPLGFRRPPTLHETIQRILRSEKFRESLDGVESFEEADDFDIPDDPADPTTPWEIAADHEMESAQGWQYDRDSGNLRKEVKVPVKKPKKAKSDPPPEEEDEQA